MIVRLGAQLAKAVRRAGGTVFHNILVPIDGSPPSETAVALALRLAQDQDAGITFAHVVDAGKLAVLASGPGVDPTLAIDAAEQAGKDLLAQAAARARDAGVQAQTTLVEGETVSAILDVAAKMASDVIVVGSHGRGGLSRMLLGSVAEGILRRSRIPVLITHAPREAAKGS